MRYTAIAALELTGMTVVMIATRAMIRLDLAADDDESD